MACAVVYSDSVTQQEVLLCPMLLSKYESKYIVQYLSALLAQLRDR